jgi:cbb3-type cytochrome oxidase subunit 3
MTFKSLDRSSRPRPGVEAPLESPGQLALIGVVVWLIGVIIHPLALLVPVGLLLLVVAGLAYLFRPKRRSMYWRGRRIDLDDARGPVQHLYSRLFRH